MSGMDREMAFARRTMIGLDDAPHASEHRVASPPPFSAGRA